MGRSSARSRLIGLAVLAVLTYLAWGRVAEDWTDFLPFFNDGLSLKFIVLTGLTMVLMPLNLALESYKWYLLVNHFEELPFTKAVKATLIGLCLGMVSPNRIGDYWGRVSQLAPRHRKEMLGGVALCHVYQMSVTVLMGTIALLVTPIPVIGFFQNLNIQLPALVIGLGVAVLSLLAVIFFWKNFPKREVISANFQNLRILPFRVHAQMFLSAIFRYLVFGVQFVLLLLAFGLEMEIGLIFCAVALVFLMRSVMPAINMLAELGIREVAAVMVFGLLQAGSGPVVAASLLLWCINLMLPACVGMFLHLSSTDRIPAG